MLRSYKLVFMVIIFGFIKEVKTIEVIKAPTAREGETWWKNAVFYQIYPRSFKDDNNDGIGDLQGIISKLQHLKDLGITAAWLSPIYKSPQVDQGYDISDFLNIDESYGTMADFEELLDKAHAMGIKIVMDFVPNHSSDQHEWFLMSENRISPYEDFYVWREASEDGSPPNNWLSIFSNSAWQYSDTRKQYYLHQFTVQQPDLNYRNEFLVQEMKKVLTFWLDKGVDGFRMDAVPYLFEDDNFSDEPSSNIPNIPQTHHDSLAHIYTSDQPGTFDMIYQWRALIDDYNKEHGGDARIMMTEAYTNITNTMKYYGDNEKDGAHFTFNFQFVSYLYGNSSAKDLVFLINEWFAYMPTHYTANWVLGNHDNARVATKYGPERADGMNILTAFLPGVMVTYNGEEIAQENGEVSWEEGQDPNACNGLQENFETVSRDFERTPFQWDDSINGGFNDGYNPWLPVSEQYTEINLKAQSILGIKSHYHVYQKILQLRKEPAFVNGTFKISSLSDSVVAYTRTSQNGTVYIVVINIADKEEIIDIAVFPGIKQNVKVIVANTESNHWDRVLCSNNITLSPFEAFVAQTLPGVSEGNAEWWKSAVFYQIYPRSFKDDNNDGIGDLQGIISKIGHLKDAGVTAAWLSPIYESPQVDQGYDISNYTNIDGDYGTLSDFTDLLNLAHELGIKVIMDFVPNHSSDQHEWFKKSERREEGYEDFYIWRNGTGSDPPNNWLSRFKYSAWEYSQIRGEFYLHQFAIQQPDLNYRNPVVVEEMKKVLKFWLDLGVDGFRMDAVNYLFEDDQFRNEPVLNVDVPSDEYEHLNHMYTLDQPGTYDMIYEWRTFVDDYTKEYGGDARIIMTEAYTDIQNTMLYYGSNNRDGAHFTFNFQLITKINSSSKANDVVNAIEEWNNNIPSKYISNWVIGNHDNNRVATRFGPQNVDGFNMLVALLPGILVTYNGEEIGQEDGEVTWVQGKDPSGCNGLEKDFSKTSRDFERTPFQWDDTPNAGFNNGHEPWLPVSKKYKDTNLKAQSNLAVVSHYQIYKQLIQLRKESIVHSGNVILAALNDWVVVLTRTYGNSTYVFLFNFGEQRETVDVSSVTEGLTSYLEVIIASSQSTQNKGNLLNSKQLTLEPHDAIIANITSRIPPRASINSGNKIVAKISPFVAVLYITFFSVGLLYIL